MKILLKSITKNSNTKKPHKFYLNSIQSAITSSIGRTYKKSDKYLFCIQGPTTSGKSTFTKTFKTILEKNGLKVLTIHLDNYYKSTGRNVQNYNFDDPSAFDWPKIVELLKAIENNDEKLPLYYYSFETWICAGPVYIENIQPDVVIFEGIYAFNIVNDYVFNVDEMDPFVKFKIVSNEYVKNSYKPRFKIMKIGLTNCMEKAARIRIERDSKERGRTKEDAANQFFKYSWPSTLKWVFMDGSSVDILIVHGSLNEKMCLCVMKCVANFFLNKEITYMGIECEMDMREECKGICSDECKSMADAKVILYDE